MTLYWAFIESNSNDQSRKFEHYVNICVRFRLSQIWDQLRADQSRNSLFLQTTRVLNFFERDRTHSKPFKLVQEEETLHRYVDSWSRLLLFLIRLRNIDLHADMQRLCQLQTRNQWLVDQIITKLDILHEVFIDVSDLKQLLNAQQVESLVEFNENNRLNLKLHARELKQLINRLFIRLIRREYNDDVFNVKIVNYFVVCTLNRHED